MKTVRLTMAQALVRFLENQYMEVDGAQHRFVRGVFIIPGHGNVVGLGQALSQEAKHLEIYQGKNEQGMAQAAVAFAKQMKRKQICVATSSVGPGAANMVTACGTATANNIPLLVLPGDTYACRQPDPVLQQVEHTNSLATTTNDAFKAVCRYWDRVVRPEQLMSAMINAFRVLTDPANTGAVCVAMPQDVEGEAYDYPVSFFAKRVWRLERRPATEAALADAAEAIRQAKRPRLICGGGVRYSEAHAEFLHFAETFGIPYGETQAGKSATDWLHPLNLGGVGTTGCSAANEIARKADLVIGVGTRYTDFTTASKWLFMDTGVDTYNMEYGYSTMGYEVAGALGVKLAIGDKHEVYSFCGDGSFNMLHGELITACQEHKKINICLFDNASFGCINNLQVGHGNVTLCTELRYRNKDGLFGNFMNIDYAKVAEAYGCKSYTVRTMEELVAAFEDAKKVKNVPVLFDIKVLPKTMTDGYSSWWRVGDTEVSERKENLAAYADLQAHLKEVRKY